jgi:glycosyltransferase involved in cell wall biosynthesis
VGRLVPEKGIFDLLESYAKLEGDLRSEVGLVFAGDGVSREELAQLAKRISPGDGLFSGIRAAARSSRSVCAGGMPGVADAQRPMGLGGE